MSLKKKWRARRLRRLARRAARLSRRFDNIMRREDWPRWKRRQFWRDFIKDGDAREQFCRYLEKEK